MRALCGAIISAGALIGLGLTAIGIGVRYERAVVPTTNGSGTADNSLVLLSQMDRPLVFTLVFLTSMAVVGLGIALLGLAYHHHRREREYRAGEPVLGGRVGGLG